MKLDMWIKGHIEICFQCVYKNYGCYYSVVDLLYQFTLYL